MVKFSTAVDTYLADLQRMGRIASPHTEDAYRRKLTYFGEVVMNRDPSKVGRDDVKRYLSRWAHPNTQAQAHAIAVSFFDYAMEEGWRKDNPARQVRRAKRRKPDTYRMTRAEVRAFLAAANAPGRRRDRWVAHLACCAGLRSAELRSLQGRHFARPGWVWVEQGKGQRQRWVPVLADLEAVVAEILTLTGLEEFVIPGRRHVDPPWNTKMVEHPLKPVSPSALYKQILVIGERAGIAGRVTPHVCRHAYGDHIAKYAGLRVAQALLGHEDVNTTAGTYTGRPSLDELAAQVRGFSFYRAHVAEDAPSQGVVMPPGSVMGSDTGGDTR